MRELIIIGGGIIGLLAARELASRGDRVTVVDTPRARPGASWAGGGILAPLFPWRHPAPVMDLCRHAFEEYQALGAVIRAAGGADPETSRSGMLVYAPGEAATALRWGREQAVRVERRDASSVEPNAPAGEALWLPELGQVRNPRLLAGIRHLLKGCEAVSLCRESVRHLEPVGPGWRVTTEKRTRNADAVLIAAGAWSAALLEPLGLRWPLLPVKGEMLRYPPGVPAPGRILLSESGYLIPRADGSVLAGSTLEAGVTDLRPSRAAAQRLVRAAGRLWPPLRDAEPVLQWAGLRPGSRRELPLIGPVPGHPGLYVAVGHYRYGLTAAPATARLIAALIRGESPPLDPAPFAPGREPDHPPEPASSSSS